MTLAKMIEELTSIAEYTIPTDIEVAVQGWGDSVYDSNKIEGIRLVNDRDYEENKSHTTLFIVYGRGK